jgi:methyl-accepting chemotaxis protein
MTGDEMERAIQFLIEFHAKISSEIEGLKEAQERAHEAQERAHEAQERAHEAQERTAANIDSLTGIVLDLAQSVSRVEEQAEINRQETRDAINNLLLGNEVTRSLAQDVARLAIATSQRVTTLEEKLG